MNTIRVKLRVVLAQNLKALMDASEDLNGQSALHRRTRVAQATIGRILSGHGNNARIETVEKIAAAFGLSAWQLLIPGFTPEAPPVLRCASAEEKALYERLKSTVDDIGKLNG